MENDAISKEMLEQFAQTGGVALTTEEKDSILKVMNDQLKVIHELSSIPMDATLSPHVHGNPFSVEIQAGLREDIWIPFPNPQDIIAQAPRSADGFVIAPDVPHQKIG